MANQRDPFSALWNFLDGDAWLDALSHPIASLLQTPSFAKTGESSLSELCEPELSETELIATEPIVTELRETELIATELCESELSETEPIVTNPIVTELRETEPIATELREPELSETESIETELFDPEPIEPDTQPDVESPDFEPIETEWIDLNPDRHPDLNPDLSIVTPAAQHLTPVIEIQYDCDGSASYALQPLQSSSAIQAVDYVPTRIPDHAEIITLGEPFMNDRYDSVYDSLIRSLARRKQEALAAELSGLFTAIQHQGYSYADLLGAIREILSQQALGSEWNDCLHDLDRAINSAQRAQGLSVDTVDQLEDRPRLEESRDRDRREWSNNPITG